MEYLTSFVESVVDPTNVVNQPTRIDTDPRARRMYARALGVADTRQIEFKDPRVIADMRAKLVWSKFGGVWNKKTFVDRNAAASTKYPGKKDKIFDQEQLNVFNLTRAFGLFRAINTTKKQWDNLATKLAHRIGKDAVVEIVKVAMELSPKNLTSIQFEATYVGNEAEVEVFSYEPYSKSFISNKIHVNKWLGLDRMTAADWKAYHEKRKAVIEEAKQAEFEAQASAFMEAFEAQNGEPDGLDILADMVDMPEYGPFLPAGYDFSDGMPEHGPYLPQDVVLHDPGTVALYRTSRIRPRDEPDDVDRLLMIMEDEERRADKRTRYAPTFNPLPSKQPRVQKRSVDDVYLDDGDINLSDFDDEDLEETLKLIPGAHEE